MQKLEKVYLNAVLRGKGKMEKLRDFLLCPVKGESNFVATLILIIIAVAIGVTFKDQIGNFVTTITQKTTTEALNLF